LAVGGASLIVQLRQAIDRFWTVVTAPTALVIVVAS
jgi:hypothetical protein